MDAHKGRFVFSLALINFFNSSILPTHLNRFSKVERNRIFLKKTPVCLKGERDREEILNTEIFAVNDKRRRGRRERRMRRMEIEK